MVAVPLARESLLSLPNSTRPEVGLLRYTNQLGFFASLRNIQGDFSFIEEDQTPKNPIYNPKKTK
jgi:hypothetical protein